MLVNRTILNKKINKFQNNELDKLLKKVKKREVMNRKSVEVQL